MRIGAAAAQVNRDVRSRVTFALARRLHSTTTLSFGNRVAGSIFAPIEYATAAPFLV